MRKQTEAPSPPRGATSETGQAVAGCAGHAALSFYVDPICPWAWRTASWIREVRGQVPIDVQWKFFSLAAANGLGDPAMTVPLRVLALVREQAGNQAVERLYFALGQLIHEEGRDIRATGAVDDVVEKALERAGFPRDLLQRAVKDPSTNQRVLDEYEDAKRRYRAYGVPWLVLDGRDFGFQGPVIQAAPKGETAVELWRHISWLLGQPYFYELKRSR